MSVPEEIIDALMMKALEDYYDWGEELSEEEEQSLREGIINTLELVGPMFEAHALEKVADLAEEEDNGLRNLTRDFDGNLMPLYVTTDWLREKAKEIREEEGE